jgi:AcrR family transcriptional regulator
MPKETFYNLSEEKRNRFVQIALEEFAYHDFQAASITQIVKKLGIAKGSVYQYFDDKLDLWLYLKKYSEEIKISYITSLKREDYPNFWEYYRAMYLHGINFDLEHPLCSLLLYRIGFKESSEQVKPYLHTWKEEAKIFFRQWIEAEKKLGTFEEGIATDIIVHFLLTMSLSITELLQDRYHIDFEKNISEGKPLFGKNKEELIKAVNDLIFLMERALKIN